MTDEQQQRPAAPAPPRPAQPPAPPPAAGAEDRARRRAERRVALALTATILAGLSLFVVYFQGGNPQLEGVLFLVALGGLGAALAIWGERLLDAREAVEERYELASGPATRRALLTDFEAEAGPEIRRRSFLVRLLAAAAGALGLSLLLPVLSLGPSPGNTLKVTAWRRGLRLVTEDGNPVRAEAMPVDSVLTVYPEGHEDAADAQALLIRVPEGLLNLPPERLAVAPNGIVAYSKLCTHAGCPVGLYRAADRSLLCPCHQSQFNVLNGAEPFFGPAARPLPQLPLGVDGDGYLVALGDFFEPAGPAFWDMYKGERA